MTTSTSQTARLPRFDSLYQQAYLNLWRTYDRLKAIEDDLFARSDLSAQQYNALRLLQAAHPGTIPTLTLGARLISRAPDMTRMLDRLEDRGLVRRMEPRLLAGRRRYRREHRHGHEEASRESGHAVGLRRRRV